MANATFGVNIVPRNDTVTIGNSDSPWHIVNPILTGTPVAPTASAGTSTSQIATTEFVHNANFGNVKSVPNEKYKQSTITEYIGDEYYIGDSAFYSCPALSQASFNNCVYVGSEAFASCYALQTISFPNCISISSFAFYNCSALTAASIPKCQIIGPYAFNGCSNLSEIDLTNCTHIEYNAFGYCTSLTTVSAHECLEIGNGAFYGCTSLSEASFYSCKKIGNRAFRNCYSLTGIFMQSVETIGESAFENCTSLAIVDLPCCKSIGANAFTNCKNISMAFITDEVNIGPSAFLSCSTLSYLQAGRIKYIYEQGFANCTALSYIYLDECLVLGYGAFQSCTSLSEVSAPKLQEMSGGFAYCSNLESVYLPVCSIVSGMAFTECTALSTISLPKCTVLGGTTFMGCTSLMSLYLMNSSVVSLAGTMTFTSTPMSDSSYTGSFGSIYVPASLLQQYKVASRWSAYADRFVGVQEPELIKEYTSTVSFPATGNTNSLYIETTNNTTYRWDETNDEYVQVGGGGGSSSSFGEFEVNILTSDWTGSGPYTYVWQNSIMKTTSFVDVYYRDGIRDGLTSDLEYVKGNGTLTITVEELPEDTVPIMIRVIGTSMEEAEAAQIEELNFNPSLMLQEVKAVTGIRDATIRINRSNSSVDSLPAKSLQVLAFNGNATDIAQAIKDTNTSGLATYGTISRTIDGETIYLSRPSALAVHVALTLKSSETLDMTTLEGNIKSAVFNYINSLSIGEALQASYLGDVVKQGAGTSASLFEIQDLTMSGTFGVKRDFVPVAWNQICTCIAQSEVVITTTLVPLPDEMTGATSSTDGTSGLVPAPLAGQNKLYLKADGTWDEPDGVRLYVADLDTVTNTSGSYTHTSTVTGMTGDLKAVLIECSNPTIFKDKVVITTASNSVTLTCSEVSGTSTVKVSFAVQGNANPLSSTEYAALDTRIGDLSDLTTSDKSSIVGAVNALNSNKTDYIHYQSTASDDVTGLREMVDSLPNVTKTYIATFERSSIIACIINKTPNADYASIIYFDYFDTHKYMKKSAGIWSNPVDL